MSNQEPPKAELRSILDQLRDEPHILVIYFSQSLINTSSTKTGDKDRHPRLTILGIEYMLVDVGRFIPNWEALVVIYL